VLKQSRDFEEFYSANYGRVTALVTALLGNRSEADDIAQEAFTRALARWPRLASYELPEAWVRQVAIRLAIDSGRRFRRALRAMCGIPRLRPR
jgi:RNA polymerase sigma-70 factor, ECF subfamily